MKNQIIKKLVISLFAMMVIASGLSASVNIEQALIEGKSGYLSYSTGKKYHVAIQTDDNVEIVDEMSWKSFEKLTDEESYHIQFPDQALFTRLNDHFAATITIKDGAEYMVSSGVPAMRYTRDGQVFPLLIEKHSNYPYEMVDYRISEDKDNEVLEIVSKNLNTGKIEKAKVTLTTKNVYIASIKFPEGEDTSRDEIFLNSFAVID